MAPKTSPHNRSAAAATIKLMRHSIADLQATVQKTRALIDEGRIAIAEADILLRRRVRRAGPVPL